MCTYLAKRGSTYYFRRTIPADLRPAFDGKTEFMISLRTKDRDAAKKLIPTQTLASERELAAAGARLAVAPENDPGALPARQTELRRRSDAWERAHLEAQEAGQKHWERLDAERDERIGEQEERARALRVRITGSTAEKAPEDAVIARAIREPEREAAFWKALAEDRAAAIALLRASVEQQGGDQTSPLPVPPKSPATPLPASQAGSKATAGGPEVWLHTVVVDRWAAERQVRPKSRDAHRAVARWFYERVGQIAVSQITRKDVIAFKDALLEEGQSPQNINTKLSRLRTLLGYAVQNDLAASNAAHGINIVGSAAAPRRRLPFELADLQSIFDSPVFAQGARPTKGRGEAAYWLPLLALFSGARMEELGQLRPSDVQKLAYHDADGAEHASWFLRITTLSDEGEAENQLKNEESERLVPVHAELERLGFLDYVEAMRKAGHPRIFPKLRPGAYDRLTAKWGEWFGPYLRNECGVADRRKVFHSFRHTFKDMARHCGMREGVQRQIMGHSGEDVADDYGKGHSLYRVVEGMALYRIAGLKLPARSAKQMPDEPSGDGDQDHEHEAARD